MPRKYPKPKEDWSSTPQKARKRKMIAVTLSDEAREKLELLADAHELGTKSAVIEDLILSTKG
jgi:hypothetical protein